jgi:hypothetical protein
MKFDDAKEKIAQILREKAQADISLAKAALGDRAEVTPADIDFDAQADQLLEDTMVELAYDRIMQKWGWGNGVAAGAGCPPMPKAR